MTDDLVKRLRENDFFRDDALYWEVDTGKADALFDQAADRIEDLTAENERLREQLRLANIDAANELAENTRLRAALGETE